MSDQCMNCTERGKSVERCRELGCRQDYWIIQEYQGLLDSWTKDAIDLETENAALKATLGRVKAESSAAKAKFGWLHWRVKDWATDWFGPLDDPKYKDIESGRCEEGEALFVILSTTPEVSASGEKT